MSELRRDWFPRHPTRVPEIDEMNPATARQFQGPQNRKPRPRDHSGGVEVGGAESSGSHGIVLESYS